MSTFAKAEIDERDKNLGHYRCSVSSQVRPEARFFGPVQARSGMLKTGLGQLRTNKRARPGQRIKPDVLA
jgi:hypothetical protein